MSEPTAIQFAQDAKDLCGHEWGPCLDCTAKAIAAAEARGRKQGDAEGFRRGVEEAARLLEEYGSPVTNIAFVAAKIRAIAPREAKEET